jgi:hypothetical protein
MVAKDFLATTEVSSKRENAGCRRDSGEHVWPLKELLEKRKKAAEAAAALTAPTPMNTPSIATNTNAKKVKTTSSNIFASRDRSTNIDVKKVWTNVVKPKLELLVIEELAHTITPQGSY